MNSSFLEEWKKRKQYYLDMQQGSTSIENIENVDSTWVNRVDHSWKLMFELEAIYHDFEFIKEAGMLKWNVISLVYILLI